MYKRIISLGLAGIISLSSFGAVFADNEDNPAETSAPAETAASADEVIPNRSTLENAEKYQSFFTLMAESGIISQEQISSFRAYLLSKLAEHKIERDAEKAAKKAKKDEHEKSEKDDDASLKKSEKAEAKLKEVMAELEALLSEEVITSEQFDAIKAYLIDEDEDEIDADDLLEDGIIDEATALAIELAQKAAKAAEKAAKITVKAAEVTGKLAKRIAKAEAELEKLLTNGVITAESYEAIQAYIAAEGEDEIDADDLLEDGIIDQATADAIEAAQKAEKHHKEKD